MVISPVRVRMRLPLTPQMVADVQVLQQFEVFAQVVAAAQDLDGAGFVLYVEEGGAAHVPEGDDAAGEGQALGVGGRAGFGLDGLEQGDGGGVVAGAAIAGRGRGRCLARAGAPACSGGWRYVRRLRSRGLGV